MSSETARMAFPSLVLCTRKVRTTVAIAVTTTVTMAKKDSVRSPTWMLLTLV